MDKETVMRIKKNPNYRMLRRKRNMLGVMLTVITLFIYYGWIALIAFDREFLARPVGNGVMTIAIPIGIGVIVLTVLLTAIYIVRANSAYDAFIDKIKEEVQQ